MLYLRPRHFRLPLVCFSKQHRQNGVYEPGQIFHVRHLPLYQVTIPRSGSRAQYRLAQLLFGLPAPLRYFSTG